jgi:hypothetical protein
VIPGSIGPADVPNCRSRATVAALIHNAGEIHTLLGRRRDVPGLQRMFPEGGSVGTGRVRVSRCMERSPRRKRAFEDLLDLQCQRDWLYAARAVATVASYGPKGLRGREAFDAQHTGHMLDLCDGHYISALCPPCVVLVEV